MFFNSESEKFFPYAQIDVAQFPEGEGGDKIIEQIFKGPLHEQLRAALSYICTNENIEDNESNKSADSAKISHWALKCLLVTTIMRMGKSADSALLQHKRKGNSE